MRASSFRPRRRPSRARGIALIEALVAILIFAIGIVGLVGLQAAMTRAQGTAKFRADAAYLGTEVLGKIWADRANIGQYDSLGANCGAHQPCADWIAKVATALPQGAAQITTTPATGIVTLTVTWSTPSEGTHSHVLTSSVR